MKKAYPGFAGLVKESIEARRAAADDPRLSGHLSRRSSAPCTRRKRSTLTTPKAIYDELKANLEAAVKREGLL